MSRTRRFEHRFVTNVPAQLEEGVLYVSIPYGTAIHLCACGCRREVVTPIQPTRWSMTFDGAAVWLRPSIGNWSFPCRSHYWIERGGVVRWARTWSEVEVARARRGQAGMGEPGSGVVTGGVRARLLRWLHRWRDR